jgi:hypothetical protein
MDKFLRKIIKEELDDSMDWIKQHAFHLDLMSQNKKKIESLSEVKKILFNPAVQTSVSRGINNSENSEKFKTVAYYLEDMNYMPENLVFDEYLSYIEIKRHPQGKGFFIKNGRYFVGPTVSDDELIEMSKEVGSFWFEEFVGSFLPNRLYR